MTNVPPFLVVECNPEDAVLIQRSFTEAKVLNPLHMVKTVEEATRYLIGKGVGTDGTDSVLPVLVLLGINAGDDSPYEFLQWIRAQPALRSVRVVMLSSSERIREVSKGYQLGANSFLIKPVDFERFVHFSQALTGFWLWMPQDPEVLSSPTGLSDTAVLRRALTTPDTPANLRPPPLGTYGRGTGF